MENRLPHWQQADGIYFVTFRLADALPAERLRQWQSERNSWMSRSRGSLTPEMEAEYHRLFSQRMEQWLDAGSGSCALRARATAEVIAGALEFYEGQRSEMLSWVVMPNHVHALFGLMGTASIDSLIRDWKSYTGHVLAKRLDGNWPGWQKDYFDRLVRNESHFERCVRYIRRNPGKARLAEGAFLQWESARATAVG